MEGGIHIFCINLKHRGDRWSRFSAQPELKKLMKHYTFDRFEAVNGSAIDIQKDERVSLRTKRNIREHIRRDHEELDSAGGIGCYLSHTSVWKKVVERPEPYAIVFEDDAIIPEGFTEDFQLAMKDATLLPQAPDVWFFSIPSPWYFEYKGKPNPKDVKKYTLGPWITNTCSAFTGYLVSKKGAEKLLETAFPIDMHVDLYTCLVGDLNRILTVCHRDIIVKPYQLKTGDTDIQVVADCPICSVPTNFEKRGIIMLNIPIFMVALAVIGGMYYLGSGSRRRR
jgi:GR25 family glycosyltransferase involved in LPS biosynthesis